MSLTLASLLFVAAQPAQAATPSPAPAEAPNADAAAVAAACGGEIYPADIPKISKAELARRLACFTREAAKHFNLRLPQQVDAKTTLQRVSAEGTILTYHYTVDLLRSELPPGALDAFKPTVRTKVCGAADMRNIISLGGSYRYVWLDRNGEAIGELLVSSC
jgi:hypothetical protein